MASGEEYHTDAAEISIRAYCNPRPLTAAVLQSPRSLDAFQNIECDPTATATAPTKAPGTRLQPTCALTRQNDVCSFSGPAAGILMPWRSAAPRNRDMTASGMTESASGESASRNQSPRHRANSVRRLGQRPTPPHSKPSPCEVRFSDAMDWSARNLSACGQPNHDGIRESDG